MARLQSSDQQGQLHARLSAGKEQKRRIKTRKTRLFPAYVYNKSEQFEKHGSNPLESKGIEVRNISAQNPTSASQSERRKERAREVELNKRLS